MADELFAGQRVRDLATARPWYEQLLGDVAFAPNDEELVWALADGGHIYVLVDPERAGHGLVTLFVEDLDAWLGRIAARGLVPDTLETYSNGERKATFRDPDGNEIGLGGASAED